MIGNPGEYENEYEYEYEWCNLFSNIGAFLLIQPHLEEESMILEPGVSSLYCGKHPCHCYTCSALDVVVECAVLVPVLFKESEGIVVAKVFKLDQGVLPPTLHNRGHELINELIISLASDPLMPKTDVVNVVKQLLPVGANIESDG